MQSKKIKFRKFENDFQKEVKKSKRYKQLVEAESAKFKVTAREKKKIIASLKEIESGDVVDFEKIRREA